LGKPWRATWVAGTLSQPVCSTVTRVSSPRLSKRISTSVSWSGANAAWRQPNTSRRGGSQARILPISNTFPLARVSVSRPPSPGSNASRPGSRGVKAKSGLARHQTSISSTNAPHARSGDALTRIATNTREPLTPGPSPDAP
jgi:hypothetical protein